MEGETQKSGRVELWSLIGGSVSGVRSHSLCLLVLGLAEEMYSHKSRVEGDEHVELF
ncbi:hypothetical protein RchiOBHm_Chr6g0287431 [Rosa chinensis]|uniref:Uncharacterized protein n=1 Tax=Rosa chinensis TaxID=74649 RepID=A0A2P6PV35_ROSCH|nr:hypothetical protein RchiOBHm_Chr6g0287431 [Rosa chinensis]